MYNCHFEFSVNDSLRIITATFFSVIFQQCLNSSYTFEIQLERSAHSKIDKHFATLSNV